MVAMVVEVTCTAPLKECNPMLGDHFQSSFSYSDTENGDRLFVPDGIYKRCFMNLLASSPMQQYLKEGYGLT